MNRYAERVVVFAMLACCIPVMGCSSTVTWKEEMQLSDGKRIVIERETLNIGGGDEWAHGSGSRPKERRIRFVHPDGSGQVVEWRSTKMSPGTYPETPLVLDFDNGILTTFSIVAISEACEIYSKYIYRNGGWIEEPLPDQFDKRMTNLFLRDSADMPAFVRLEEKRKNNEDYRYRLRLKQVGPNRMVCGA